MAALNLFRHSSDKPRLSIRERFRSTAAKILPRVSRRHRKGGGTDAGRRALVKGYLASVGVLAAGQVAYSGSAIAGPDKDLLELGHQYLEAYREWDAFCETEYTSAEELEFALRPTTPDILRVRGTDYFTLNGIGTPSEEWTREWVAGPDGEPVLVRIFGEPEVEEFRATPRTRQDFQNGTEAIEDGERLYYPGRKPDPKAQARADEIVAAHDEWERAKNEARERSGLRAAEEKYNGMVAALASLIERIAATHATTLQGLIIKAQCAEAARETAGNWDREIAQAVKHAQGNYTATALGLSLARDLSALGQTEA